MVQIYNIIINNEFYQRERDKVHVGQLQVHDTKKFDRLSLKYNNDADCVYIFNNLPQDLQKMVDDLAGEVVKANNDKLKELDVMIEFVTQYNKQLDDDIYRLQHQLDNTRELNRQLGIF